jgi:two-component system NtrC family sensor kinase
MIQKSQLRARIENNGLILIALAMVVIYWVFDYISSGHYLTRTLIAVLVIVYGIFTQSLINSRKAALEEKEQAQERLIRTEKLAALGAVAAGIAHEVKNPLAIIVQGVEFLKSALYKDPRLLDVTHRIEKSVIRADNIIKGLLSYSREISLKMEELDIVPVIEETLTFIEHQIHHKNISVKTKYAPGLPKIIMDSSQIKQVFTNLFMNAIESMQDSGILGVRIDSLKKDGDRTYVRISVSDTGSGIPQENINRIFDPFFTTKNADGNTGLGLSITKGIIDKHHGTIEVESEPGRGTRIIVGLPAGLE